MRQQNQQLRVLYTHPLYAMLANVGLSTVRCSSRGYISKTKQNRPTFTVVHYTVSEKNIHLCFLA